MAVYKVGSARKPTGNLVSFVGEVGDLFYSIDDTRLRISDGATPGGTLLSTGGDAEIPNSITDLSDADQTVRTTDNVTFGSVTGNVITSQIDSADSSAIEIQTDVTMLAGLTVGNDIIPSSTETIDLGSATNRFNELFLSGSTIDLGGALIKKEGNTVTLPLGSKINGKNIGAHDQELNTTDTVTFANIITAGYLRGPASFVIDPAAFGDDTGTVVIAGNLQVDGVQTTINSTTISIDDLNLTLASGAANASAANGAGITIDGASATFTYVSGSDRWTMNKDLAADLVGNVTGNVTGSAGTVTSLSNRSVGDLSDVDITTTAPTNNQALVWDNANGKFIPGDSFSQSDFDTAFTSKDTDDLSEGTTNLYYTNARADARISAADTDDLSEGSTNLYYTNARFDTRFTAKSTTNLSEGTNLYYTNARADARIALQVGANLDLSSKTTTDLAEGTKLYYTDARFDTRFTAKSTTNLSEGTNLYYTNARADARIAAASIDDLTDVDITTAAPTNNQVLVWDNANSKFIPGDAAADFTDLTGKIAASQIPNSIITSAMLDPTNVFSQEFTANGSTSAFTLSTDPGSKNAIQVFIDGVPQRASNYTVVGTTLTLGGTPVNGQVVEVRGYGIGIAVGTVADDSITGPKLQDGTITADKISSAAYASQTFTGDNSTTAFTLNNDPGTAQALLVMVENVIQEPIENYTTSGTTLTFTGVPALNARIYVRYLGLPLNNTTPPNDSVTNAKLNLTYTSNQYTGDNTTTAYTIASGHTINSVLVVLDGSILPPADYSISGTTLTFGSAPLTSQSIDIRYMPV